ncbi:MAG TPA: hypothetical protein VGU03_10845 [Frateuria sp.]|uniref:hypothetical protein n=1 Tax=Frateuria sp. TaxID=2211372 RepID=UPI002DF18B57|nr:hypothetical protein [Frateuria sp.]
MATVIDALVMTLGLDTASFDKGHKRASEGLEAFRKKSDAAAKQVAEGGKRMAEGFSAVRNQLLGLLAAFGAATTLKDFIASNVDGQAALSRLSRNLGISTRELEAWGTVAKEMGGQAQDAFGVLNTLAAGIAEAQLRGHSGLTDAARLFGIDLTGVKTAEDALLRISDRLSKMPRQMALVAANQLGVGGMFNPVMQGSEALQQQLAEASRMSRVTDESAKAAERLQKQWALIQLRFKGASELAFDKLSPVLERLATRFADWLDAVDWDAVARKIEKLADEVVDVVKAFGGWKAVAIALGGILALKVLSPVLGLIGGLGRLLPLLASTTAGLWAMAAAGAAAAGYGIGTLIHKQIEGTKADDAIGYSVALVKSYFGDQEATKAILRNEYGVGDHVSNQRVKDLAALDRARQSRGRRNNNPGNLNFVGQAGAHLESGPNARFAAFDSLQEGIAALVRQLALYASRGIDTISGIVRKYAPSADGNNVAAYIASLARATGKGANEHLDLSNLDTLIPLVRGIARHEGNGTLSTDDILGGIRLGARQQAPGRTALASRTSTSETHIGSITVNTRATDAQGIARDLRGALQNNSLVALADTGVD